MGSSLSRSAGEGSIASELLNLSLELEPRSDDLVQPFRLDPFALRGRLVRLGPTVDRILSQHDYPDPVAAILGEAITLAIVLAGALKYDGIFTLQTKSDGPVKLIVADVSTEGAVRGYAQYDAERLEAAMARGVQRGHSPSVPDLIGSGYIAFTVDQGEDTERYQAIVELVGATLAECAQHYFRQSEQLQAGIKLSVARSGPEGAWRAGGLMLQRVPPEGGYTVNAEDVEDAWRRAIVLMSSATSSELVDPGLSPHRLLFRLFHDESVRVFRTHPLEAKCRCSRERIANILRAFPAEDMAELRKDEVTSVTCEFCNTRYEFTRADLAGLSPA
jgi:molecular chaperone Hsp33